MSSFFYIILLFLLWFLVFINKKTILLQIITWKHLINTKNHLLLIWDNLWSRYKTENSFMTYKIPRYQNLPFYNSRRTWTVIIISFPFNNLEAYIPLQQWGLVQMTYSLGPKAYYNNNKFCNFNSFFDLIRRLQITFARTFILTS